MAHNRTLTLFFSSKIYLLILRKIFDQSLQFSLVLVQGHGVKKLFGEHLFQSPPIQEDLNHLNLIDSTSVLH